MRGREMDEGEKYLEMSDILRQIGIIMNEVKDAKASDANAILGSENDLGGVNHSTGSGIFVDKMDGRY